MDADAWQLKQPAWHTGPQWDESYGPEVGDLCRQIGFRPDPEQQLVLNALFAVGEDGISVSYETAVVATRQMLKTGVAKMAALGWLFLLRVPQVTWSAHLFATTQEAMRDISTLIESSSMLRRRMPLDSVRGIHTARGAECIETRNGDRLLFRARTKGGGRGLTGHKIILDEALYLEPEHIGALHPTLTVVPDPQILYLSSAGLIRSDILREIRDRGRAGVPDLTYFEWGAPKPPCPDPNCLHIKPSHPSWKPGCAADDESLWLAANPLIGRTRIDGTGLNLARFRKFREAEPPEEFVRERLGWWEDPGLSEIFGLGNWDKRKVDLDAIESYSVETIGVAVSFDMQWSSIYLGGRANVTVADEDGTLRQQIKRIALPSEHAPGIDWVIDRLVELRRDHPDVPIIIDGGGPAATLSGRLDRELGRMHKTSTPEYLDACADMFVDVVSGRLVHCDWPEFNLAVAWTVKRPVGERWAWGRRASGGDISGIEAATLALWALDREFDFEPVSAYEADGVGTI